MIGQLFGNYRAIALLGEGGMGAVYLAEHPNIGRKVAVKVLRSDLASDPNLLARFINEARAANAIRHPNIIEILDAGTTDSGIAYLVMELLEGESLAARIKRLGRIDPAAAVAFALQTASALGAAHAKGIIHRDLKPDNLFVVPDVANPGQEHIKVLDFGIAKLQAKMKSDSVKTRTGTLMGTPAYMSPEQCLGTKEVDHRSDIYSLGIIVYEMLAGAPPFVSDGFGALVNMHLNEAPMPLSARMAGLPPGLEPLVSKMLAKSPELRQQSMAELYASLSAAAGMQPIPYAPAPSVTQVLVEDVATQAGLKATTLSNTAGERMAATAPARRAGVPVWLIGGAALGLGLAIFFVVKPTKHPQVAGPASTVTATQAAAGTEPKVEPARLIHVRLESSPSAARIVRVSDGVVLGTTPQVMELRAAHEPLRIRLEKEGHVPEEHEIRLETDSEVELALQPEKAEAKTDPKPTTGKKHPDKHHPDEASGSGTEPAKL